MKKPVLFFCFALTATVQTLAQSSNWKTDGNLLTSADWFGSTNNEPLIFKTNNQTRFQINANGNMMFKEFDGLGTTGLFGYNSNGRLVGIAYTGSSTDVLLGTGSFGSIGALTGWFLTPGITYTMNKVGIKTTTPTADFEVNGTGKFTGSLTAAGENYFPGKSHFYRILPMPGDSIIRFGDNTINFDHTNNRIYTTAPSSSLASGLGIGIGATSTGGDAVAMGAFVTANARRSFAFGYYVKASAIDAFTIGRGTATGSAYLENTITNSLMIGFNSTVPTLFIGPATGGTTLGKIGIGTTSPEELFEIKPNANFKLSFGNASYADLNSGTIYMGFNAVRTAGGTWSTAGDGINNGGSVMYSNVQGHVYFASIPRTGGTAQTGISNTTISNNTRMFIDGNTGAVGIGTTCIPANTKLAVNGTIYAKDVWVKEPNAAGCWPDYVFDSNYAKVPLNQLESYINQNKHLPNIPSATEVEENGVQLGEMQRLQMEKMEELYLYMIELNKKVEKLEAENAELKKQVNK